MSLPHNNTKHNCEIGVYSDVYIFDKTFQCTEEDTLKDDFNLSFYQNFPEQDYGFWDPVSKEDVIIILAIYRNWLKTFKKYFTKECHRREILNYVLALGRHEMLEYMFEIGYNVSQFSYYYLCASIDLYDYIEKYKIEREKEKERNRGKFNITSGIHVPGEPKYTFRMGWRAGIDKSFVEKHTKEDIKKCIDCLIRHNKGENLFKKDEIKNFYNSMNKKRKLNVLLS